MVVNKFREKLAPRARSGHRRSIEYESIPTRVDGVDSEHWLRFNRINSRLVEAEVGDNLLSGGSNERAELIPLLNLAR